MEWRPLMTPRVLIVEDKETQLQGIMNDLDTIDPDRLNKFGIESFDTHTATALDEAERAIAEANGTPFDLMLLDLGIPLTRQQPDSDVPENGQQLLAKARRMGAVKEVVVVSAFNQFNEAARAFSNGVMDFIAKPFKTTELQARVMECWKRLLKKESDQLLGAKRIRDLVPYAEKGLAYRFYSCFSNLAGAVEDTTSEITRYMGDTGWEGGKNSQAFILSCLDQQRESLSKSRKDWAALNGALQASGETSAAAMVETLLWDIHQRLLPILIVKNIQLEFINEAAAEILSFEDDVAAVLKEIIVGAASTLKDFDSKKHLIEIRVTEENGGWKITFSDKLRPITSEDAEQINRGLSVSPLSFDRAWGLSVVQQIAMKGAGRLEVIPLSNGNTINYYVPSWQNERV
jgi:CheY-like chemotaxis protein